MGCFDELKETREFPREVSTVVPLHIDSGATLYLRLEADGDGAVTVATVDENNFNRDGWALVSFTTEGKLLRLPFIGKETGLALQMPSRRIALDKEGEE